MDGVQSITGCISETIDDCSKGREVWGTVNRVWDPAASLSHTQDACKARKIILHLGFVRMNEIR